MLYYTKRQIDYNTRRFDAGTIDFLSGSKKRDWKKEIIFRNCLFTTNWTSTEKRSLISVQLEILFQPLKELPHDLRILKGLA